MKQAITGHSFDVLVEYLDICGACDEEFRQDEHTYIEEKESPHPGRTLPVSTPGTGNIRFVSLLSVSSYDILEHVLDQ